MSVGIDETGQGNPAAAIGLKQVVELRNGHIQADRPDAPVDAQDVDRRVFGQAGPGPDVTDQQPPAHALSL